MEPEAVRPFPGRSPVYAVDSEADSHGHVHGVCWAAIVAGAVGAAALSLILLMLGVGLGLSSVSPWATEGISASTFGVSTIAWLTFTQLAASAAGGYLAGRLKTRWSTAVHSDEVYFRDTAHGFLAWSLATIVTAGLLSSAVGAIVSGGAKTGAAVAGTAATAAGVAAPGAAMVAGSAGMGQGYFVDTLFRRESGAAAPVEYAASGSGRTAPNASTPSESMAQGADGGGASAGEAARIFANSAGSGALPPEDARYLGQLVAQQTGLSQAEAENRVLGTFKRLQTKVLEAKEEARVAAEKARKASAMASLWMFVSLLIGAFVASFVATVGASHRDRL